MECYQCFNRSLLSLTAHWISDSFGVIVSYLTCCCIKRITYWQLENFNNMLSTWNISKDDVHAVLSDNISNMCKAMKDYLCSYGCCFVHSLRLVVNVHIVTDLLESCKSIVGHYRWSTLVCA